MFLCARSKSPSLFAQVDNADWSIAFRDKLFNVTACEKWAVVYPPKEEAETKQFIQALMKTSMGLGFRLGKPKEFPIGDNKTASYIQKINEVLFLLFHLTKKVLSENIHQDICYSENIM